MNEAFSTRLRKLGNSIWEAQHVHPFVRGIAEATLDLERFRFWVRQGYLFLIEYGRLLALAAARAPSLQATERFVDLAHATLTVEMQFHRKYALEFGIAQEELDMQLMAPTNRAYTDFLLRTAALGDFAELAAALLPCMWGFAEIGERLGREDRPDDPRYASWIEMYASAEFQRLAGWCQDLVDSLATGAGMRRCVGCRTPSSCLADMSICSGTWRGASKRGLSDPKGSATSTKGAFMVGSCQWYSEY